MQGDLDPVAVTRDRLVDAVIDDLEHEMVQAGEARRADIHRGAHPDALESLEDADFFRGVVGLWLFGSVVLRFGHVLMCERVVTPR